MCLPCWTRQRTFAQPAPALLSLINLWRATLLRQYSPEPPSTSAGRVPRWEQAEEAEGSGLNHPAARTRIHRRQPAPRSCASAPRNPGEQHGYAQHTEPAHTRKPLSHTEPEPSDTPFAAPERPSIRAVSGDSPKDRPKPLPPVDALSSRPSLPAVPSGSRPS